MVMILLVVLLALLFVFVTRQARAVLAARRARAVASPAPVVPKRGVDARFSGRVFAAVLLGVALGWMTLLSVSSDRTKGRDAYIQQYADRFDRVVSKPQSTIAVAIFMVFTTGMVIGAYELLAWGVTLAIGSTKRNPAA